METARSLGPRIARSGVDVVQNWRDTEVLYRIDPDTSRSEVTAAG
jgi:hypothetical protein